MEDIRVRMKYSTSLHWPVRIATRTLRYATGGNEPATSSCCWQKMNWAILLSSSRVLYRRPTRIRRSARVRFISGAPLTATTTTTTLTADGTRCCSVIRDSKLWRNNSRFPCDPPVRYQNPACTHRTCDLSCTRFQVSNTLTKVCARACVFDYNNPLSWRFYINNVLLPSRLDLYFVFLATCS